MLSQMLHRENSYEEFFGDNQRHLNRNYTLEKMTLLMLNSPVIMVLQF